jgi:CheY-like chemotaxis protein
MVEDNEINQRIASKYLEKMGEKVTIAANGVEALEKMKNETFDILFVDLQMPYMNGYDLTRRIREAEREATLCDTQDSELLSYSASGSSTPPPTPPGSSSLPINGQQSVFPFSSLAQSPSSQTSLRLSTRSSPIILNISSASSSSSSNYSSSSSSSSESSSSSYSHSQLPSPTTSSSNSSNSGLPTLKNNVNSNKPVPQTSSPTSPPTSPPTSHKRHKHLPIVACTANVLDEEKGRCKQHGMDGFLSKPYLMEELKQCIEELVESDEESSGGNEEGGYDYKLQTNHYDHGYEKDLSIAPI